MVLFAGLRFLSFAFGLLFVIFLLVDLSVGGLHRRQFVPQLLLALEHLGAYISLCKKSACCGDSVVQVHCRCVCLQESVVRVSPLVYSTSVVGNRRTATSPSEGFGEPTLQMYSSGVSVWYNVAASLSLPRTSI